MTQRKTTPPAAPSALIIPFPRSGVPPHKRSGSFGSAEFNSGFECAMSLLQTMKKRGLLRGIGG